MFFFLPIGLDESGVNRLPWVTISIAAACVLAFLGTWVLPSPSEADARYRELAEYWLKHPQLKAPEALDALASDKLKSAVELARFEHPGAATAEEQSAFDQMAAEVVALMDARPLRRYALIPARGLAQPGWLTYMFLHFGWLHLLGNFLFLYLVAPFLEDVWGRPLFAAFYLTGGLAAAFAQYLAEPHAGIAIAGASGAIAACMGAFMFRFASRRVRMFYFIWIVLRPFTGTFLLRAWLAGLFWVGSELLSLALHGAHGGGVAVLAHVGGFGFGAAFAVLLKTTGIERKHLAPAVEAKHEGWIQHPGVERAQSALAGGDREAARRAFQEALSAQPQNADAQRGLARLELEEGRLEAGSRLFERAVAGDLARGDADAIRTAVEDLGPAFHAQSLKPAVGYRIAQLLEKAGNPALAEMTYVAAGAGGGTLGAKALVRAAELRLASHTDVKGAHAYLDRLAAISGAPADVGERAADLRRALDVHGIPGGGRGIAIDESPEAMAPGRPSVRKARLLSLAADALELEDETRRRIRLALREVLAVAVAIIPAPDASGRNVVLTDLVLSWGGGSTRANVVRLPGGALSLQTLYAGVAPKDAYRRFLAHVLEASAAAGLPDKDALLKGEYPHYADVAAFEAACYEMSG